jgi:hypothetical protein
VWSFSRAEAVKFPPGGQPADATPALKSSAISWVNSAQGSHGSCPQTGLIAALQMANQASAKRKVLVYLGDGGGNCAGVDEGTYLSQTLAVVTSQNFQRITINTIGVLSYGQIQRSFLRTSPRRTAGRTRESRAEGRALNEGLEHPGRIEQGPGELVELQVVLAREPLQLSESVLLVETSLLHEEAFWPSQ